MLFDIRTQVSAMNFLQEFLNMDFATLEHEYIINSKSSFRRFWDSCADRVSNIKITDLICLAFHVTSNRNDCFDIKKDGIKNLQLVLSESNLLSDILHASGVYIDVIEKRMYYNQSQFDISYKNCSCRLDPSTVEHKLKRVAHKIFCDYQVNGFFFNNDVLNYGTRIDQRPEFIKALVELLPSLKAMEQEWVAKSTGYIVTYTAPIDQFAWYTFCEENYGFQNDVSYELHVKEWMLLHALCRCFDNSTSEIFAYMKPETIISPNQINDYKIIEH